MAVDALQSKSFLPFLETERIRALIFGLGGVSRGLTVLGTVNTVHAGYVGAAYFVVCTNVGRSGTEIIYAHLACQYINATVVVILCCSLTVL
jgi:hypothetical protein